MERKQVEMAKSFSWCPSGNGAAERGVTFLVTNMKVRAKLAVLRKDYHLTLQM